MFTIQFTNPANGRSTQYDAASINREIWNAKKSIRKAEGCPVMLMSAVLQVVDQNNGSLVLQIRTAKGDVRTTAIAL